MKKILKLQRSESFYIRDGWIEKVFSAYGDGQKEAFSTKNGTKIKRNCKTSHLFFFLQIEICFIDDESFVFFESFF